LDQACAKRTACMSDEDVEPLRHAIASKIESWLDGRIVTVWMTALTFYALVGDDLRAARLEKSADIHFERLNTIAIFSFFAEFFANTIVKAEYKWSFFFYLDLIAAVSMAPDIVWITDAFNSFLAVSEADGGGLSAGRTARLARLVRLVRLIRIVKLYSMVSKAKDAEQEEKMKAQARLAANAKQAALKRVEASRLGKVLAERTTRKVIVGILTMLLVLPNIQPKTDDQSKAWGLETLFWFGQSDCRTVRAGVNARTALEPVPELVPAPLLARPSVLCHSAGAADAWVFREGWDTMLYLYSMVGWDRHNVAEPRVPTNRLLWLRVPHLHAGGQVMDIEAIDSVLGSWRQTSGCAGTKLPETCEFREKEVLTVQYAPDECRDEALGCKEIVAYARFEIRSETISIAEFSIVQTCIVCVILFMLNLQFQNDTQRLVIAPIEKMVNIIKQLAEDPLRKPDVKSAGVLEEDDPRPKKPGGPQLETSMLENTILKIGELLQRGFGAAGAEIIGKNMSSGDGDLNIMMPGNRVTAIFGWSDVRNFTFATEILNEGVMLFINAVGNIVQTCVHKWSGVANKNVGDAFVVLWKVEEPQQTERNYNAQKHAEMAAKLSESADRSLMAFIKVLAECARSPEISFYNHHEGLLAADPQWKVKLGLGMHVGWAIEGPLGSDYKIDASYLSPAVMLSEMLEGATKVYGTPILISEKLYSLFSLRAKERIRKVDVVKVLDRVTGLYTFNVNPALPPLSVGKDHELGAIVKMDGLQQLDEQTLLSKGAEFLYAVDRDVAHLQEGIPEGLNAEYREGLVHMLEGNWELARLVMRHILTTTWPGDGPAESLYRYMESFDPPFKAPKSWPGYRELSSETIADAIVRPPIDLDEQPAELASTMLNAASALMGRGNTALALGARASAALGGSMPPPPKARPSVTIGQVMKQHPGHKPLGPIRDGA